jgi:hypothetical protein
MSIKSRAFGGITLTDSDAKKFENQVTYGKPKQQAVEAAKRARNVILSTSLFRSHIHDRAKKP